MEDFAEITALIANRATLFRYGLVGLLKQRRPGWSCAEAGVLDEVLAHLRVEPVDLLLLDLDLVGTQRATSLRQLRESFPTQRIVVMADSDGRGTILDCLAAGANGYVLKSTTMNQLLRVMEIVLSGGVFAPATLAGMPQTDTRGAQTKQQPFAGASDRPSGRGLSPAVRGLRYENDCATSRTCDWHREGASGRDLSGTRRAQPGGGAGQGARRCRTSCAGSRAPDVVGRILQLIRPRAFIIGGFPVQPDDRSCIRSGWGSRPARSARRRPIASSAVRERLS